MTDIISVSLAGFFVIYFLFVGGIWAFGKTIKNIFTGKRDPKHTPFIDEEEDDLKATLKDDYDDGDSDISGHTKDTKDTNNMYGINAE